MKHLTSDKSELWTSNELRRMVELIQQRREQELQLDYFDEEITEHLDDPFDPTNPLNRQK